MPILHPSPPLLKILEASAALFIYTKISVMLLCLADFVP